MATRTSQHINDHLLMACFGCVWVTRKWLCIFGNTASRDSLTCHSPLAPGHVLDMGMRSTWACYRAAWTSASGGIFLLQITSIPTRAKKVSTPMCRRAPQTNRIGNGRDFLDVRRLTELLQSFHIGFLDVRRQTELLQRSLNRLASPVATSATATEHGGQLASAVDWTLRLLCKMCICGFANCALAVLMLAPVGTRLFVGTRWHPLAHGSPGTVGTC